MIAEEPAAAEEPAEPKAEEAPKEPEKPKEPEEDALADSRPRVPAGSVHFSSADSTMNVLAANEGRLITSLTGGGWQYLLAGARTSVGLTAGRYLLEVKIVEMHNRDAAQQSRGPQNRPTLKVGLSLGGSSLLLGESDGSISFDTDGQFQHGKNRKRAAAPFKLHSVIGFLVNLDAGSPSANTVSLFKDGVRACQPVNIPESLWGKPLFPTISFKNVTVQVNCGPTPLAALPFKCHMLGEAAQADVQAGPKEHSGPGQLVLPVGLPEQGYFDWVDAFLEKHPDFVELSDRKIVDWAVQSGVWKPKGQGTLDKPDMKFGIPAMDDMSIKKLMLHIAPTIRRNFIIPELKANLLVSERKTLLGNFSGPTFRHVAKVVVGEPTVDFKARTQQLLVEEKREKLLVVRRRQAAEEARKKYIEERRKKQLAKSKGEGEEEAAEEKAEEPAAAEEELVVELTDEEKALWYRKGAVADMSETAVSKHFMNFTLPGKEEGFDEITYEWQSQDAAEKLMKDWIFAKKLTQRVETVQPGQFFKDAWAEWVKTVPQWKKLQGQWKDPNQRKALLAKRLEAKKKAAEEKGEPAPSDEPVELDADSLDVATVDDVADIGNGEPLFAHFAYEDWALLSARYEMHLLLHSFKKDVDDPDRQSFTEKDLGFYYQRYIKKSWSLRAFAADSIDKFVELIQDTLRLEEKSGFLQPVLPEDATPAQMVRLAEQHRRERQRRMDAGDESAELKFPRGGGAAPPANPRQGQQPQPGRQPFTGLRPTGTVVGAIGAAGAAGGLKRPAPPSHAPTTSYVAKRPTFGGAWRR
eukprot:SRR837773.8748.p1 GENE.SRR837773.8748~~SRR837773.8748.p1  ORF type:complete len:807 (-),score=339.40 SRR837773.8748:79-2499(-)